MEELVCTTGKKMAALVVVLLFGVFGGWVVIFLFGFKMPRIFCMKAFERKAIIPGLKMPALLGHIIFGLLARNYFGEVVKCYPNMWGVYLRRICLSILMVTAGLRISIKG
jgi:hypothetical protein